MHFGSWKQARFCSKSWENDRQKSIIFWKMPFPQMITVNSFDGLICVFQVKCSGVCVQQFRFLDLQIQFNFPPLKSRLIQKSKRWRKMVLENWCSSKRFRRPFTHLKIPEDSFNGADVLIRVFPGRLGLSLAWDGFWRQEIVGGKCLRSNRSGSSAYWGTWSTITQI